MSKLTKLTKLFVLLWMLSANLAFAQPKNIQLEYAVTRDGQPFATVKESFTQNGRQYKIESVTKGVGVYALFGERKLSSSGELTSAGLVPSHFELHQGDNAKKSLITDFDWANSTLNMQVKGLAKTAILQKGAQDLISYFYQFMFTPPVKNEATVVLATGKKLNQYQYKVSARGQVLEAANKQFKTTLLDSVETQGESTKQLWLAEEAHFLPVRYRLIDKSNAVIEQTLTKIHVE